MKKLTLYLLLIPAFLFAQTELSISKAIQIALENNYDIQIASQDYQIAEISNSWGAAGALPSLSFNLPDRYTQTLTDLQTTTDNRLTGSVALNWRVFNGFSVYISKKKLNEYENLSAGALQILVENTIQSVILAYYNVLYENEKLKVLETVNNLSEDRFQAEEQRKNIGTLTTFDLLQAKNAWLEDKASFLQQQAFFKNAERELLFLMGIQDNIRIDFEQEFDIEPNEYDFATIQDKMFANNTTLQNQYVYQRLLELEVQAAKYAVLPQADVSANYQKQQHAMKIDDAAWQDSESWGPTVSLSLSWSIFNGGMKRRAKQIAIIESESGEIELQALKHSLSNQLENYLELHRVRTEILNVEKEALQTAELNLQIAEEKFKNGVINSFNYRDVQLVYLNAALGRLKAIYDYIDIDIALLRLSGGISETIQ